MKDENNLSRFAVNNLKKILKKKILIKNLHRAFLTLTNAIGKKHKLKFDLPVCFQIIKIE